MENCTCASFYTVRGVHKKDCPAFTPPSMGDLEQGEPVLKWLQEQKQLGFIKSWQFADPRNGKRFIVEFN
jgi:hypothetical protein